MSKKNAFESLPDVEPTSSKEALAELKRRGYADSAALSYAKAARSWTTKDSAAWKVWKQVEAALSPEKEE